MATEVENIQTALTNIALQLANLTANYKPTTSIDGRQVSWTEHFSALVQAQESLRAQLIAAGGPFEVRSQGV